MPPGQLTLTPAGA